MYNKLKLKEYFTCILVCFQHKCTLNHDKRLLKLWFKMYFTVKSLILHYKSALFKCVKKHNSVYVHLNGLLFH